MRTFSTPDDLLDAVGEQLGTSDWLEITQERVNQFADATDDHQWIHVDPERAKTGPFGRTIAHGYLTLSLLPVLLRQIYRVENTSMVINYGLNKVRFPAPVPVGSRIRATSTLSDAKPVDGGVQVELTTTVEVEGGSKPACVAVNVVRIYR
ncbi:MULTISPECIES: MaoC family dehydratase [Thermocrispum]|jgi:acyl dehydratase|uniref:MaoC family dehydratase n=1 Tax=Thermocrispum agreste TaxID=37925 RepID=A0A2W4J7N9_9PSEU|nr:MULTISPECIES: MaoC family dehydratase [Thermocrispum]PZM94441.1 MAG: MaoC family dehydratase [Thermocrispum agreste]